MIPREKTQKLKEIAPGEVRIVCLICETPIKGRALYCEQHKGKQKNACAKCGKGTRGTICRECRKTPRPSQGWLTEADREAVQELWAQGLSAKAIAGRLGLSTKNPTMTIISRRGKGWDLPYRNLAGIERAARMREKIRK